jgi:hypothetical protein
MNQLIKPGAHRRKNISSRSDGTSR